MLVSACHFFRRDVDPPRSDDLTLTNPLLRRGTRQTLLKLDREIDVLQEDRLDRHTPLLCGVFDLRKKSGWSDLCTASGVVAHDLGDFLGETLAVGDYALKDLCDVRRVAVAWESVDLPCHRQLDEGWSLISDGDVSDVV